MHPEKLPYFRGVALGHEALACLRSDVRCDFRFRCIDVPPLQPAAPLRAFSLPAWPFTVKNILRKLTYWSGISAVFGMSTN